MGRRKGRGVHEKDRRKTPTIASAVQRPRDWDQAISVAYLRMLGTTQEIAGTSAGVSERTVSTWEGSDWWPHAVAEARHRWLRNVDAATMSGVLDWLKDKTAEGAATVRWAAEKRIPEFLPPKQRHVIEGDKENPLEVKVKARDEVAGRIDRLVASIEAARLASGEK